MKKFLGALLICLSMPALAADSFNVVFKTKGEFEFVRDMVQASIEGEGLKINHMNHIADMLNRTGEAIGASKQVYENGDQFEFCSAKLSRAMMEADPHALVMCPYIISVYKIPGDPYVYVSYRKPGPAKSPKLKKALADVEQLLTRIIKNGIE